MRRVRAILLVLVATIVLSTAALTILIATLNDNHYRWIATRAAKYFAGLEVTVEGPFSVKLSSEPFIAASKIRITDVSAPAPATAEIGRLEVKVALLPLMSGTVLIRHLLIHDATVSIVRSADARAGVLKPEEEKPSGILLPVLESVSLSNVQLTISDEDKSEAVRLLLGNLSLDDVGDDGPLYVKGEGTLNAKKFEIDGQFGSLADILKGDEPYPVDLRADVAGFGLTVSGTINNPIHGEGLNLHVVAEVAELSNMLNLLHVDVPSLGHMRLEAMITGDSIAPSVSNLKITVSGKPQFEFEAKGSIDNLLSGEGTNIQIAASCTNKDVIRLLLPDALPNFSSLEVEGILRDRQEDYVFEDMKAYASNEYGAQVKADGSLLFGRLMPLIKETDLQLKISAPTNRVIRPYLFDSFPEAGPIRGQARLTGPIEHLALENVVVNMGESSALQIKAEGRIGCIPIYADRPVSEIDLAVSMEAKKTQLLSSGFHIPLPELGTVSVSARLLGSQGQLKIDQLRAKTTNAERLMVELDGSALYAQDKTGEHTGEMNLKVRIEAPTMGAAESLLRARYFPDFGPVWAEAQLIGTTQSLSLENVQIKAGKLGVLRMELRGRVGKIPLGDDQLVSDIEVFGSIHAREASALALLAGVSVPDVGPLKATFRFVEQEGIYGFTDIQLFIGSQESLWLKGAGSLDLAMKDGSVSLGGLDAEVVASAPNLAAVPIVADLDLPDLQPLELKAHIIDRDGHLHILDVEEFKLDAGTEEGSFLRIQGQVSGLRGSDQRVVEASFKTTSKPWVMKILEGSAPENHVVEGKVRLVGTPKDMRIEELEVGTTGPKPLYLEAGGTVKEIGGAYEFEGRISSGASDMSSLQSFLGIELPRFGAPLLEGQITGNMTKGSFEGTVRFGSSQFSTTIRHSCTKQRPSVVAKIVAQTVHLADLGFYPERAEDLPSESKSESKPNKRLFSDTPLSFHALKAIDLSASVDVDKLRGEGFVLNKLDFDMSLRDGKLQVAPAKVTYKSGFASIDFTIDAVGSKPQMALKVTAEDVDIGALLTHIHEPPFLKGQLNLVVDLQSAGNSPREIATALGGEIGLAIEKGKIKRAVEFMGADAVDFLSAIRSKAEYKDLNCMAMRFIFEEGIGKSEIIYIDIPDMYARGGGYSDLHTETMKIVLQPKPKKGLRGMTSAVTIKGPIADPKVRKLPFREAAKLYGEIFMPVVFLPLRGLGYLWYLIRKDKEEESPCLIMVPRTE